MFRYSFFFVYAVIVYGTVTQKNTEEACIMYTTQTAAARIVLCLVFWYLLPPWPPFIKRANALDIIADTTLPVIVNNQTFLWHTITIKCDQTDVPHKVGSSATPVTQDFFLVEALSGGGTKRRRMSIICFEPSITHLQTKNGWVSIWAGLNSYMINSSPITRVNDSRNPKPVPLEFLSPQAQVTWLNQPTITGSARRKLPGAALPNAWVAGLAIGAAVGFFAHDLLCNNLPFLGCGSNVNDAIYRISDQLNSITDWIDGQMDWNNNAEARFHDIADFQVAQQQQNNATQDAIRALQESQGVMWEFQMRIADDMTRTFQEFRSEFFAIQEEFRQISNVLLEFIDATTQQFREVIRANQGLADQVQSLIVTVFMNAANIPQNRISNAVFWNNVDTPMIPPLLIKHYQTWLEPYGLSTSDIEDYGPPTAFLPPFGTPGGGYVPNPQLLAESHNVDKASNMGFVGVQYSVELLGSGTRTGYSDGYTLKCDDGFQLTNLMPNLPLKILLRRLGPRGCSATGTNSWKCQCVVIKETLGCDLSTNFGNVGFPYSTPNINGRDLRMANTQSGNKICIGTPQVISTTTFESADDLISSFTTSYCARTNPNERIMTFRSNDHDWAFKVLGDELSKINNVTLSAPTPGGGSGACTNTFVQVPGTDQIAGTIYYNWQQTYNILSRAWLPARERLYFGQIPDGVLSTPLLRSRDQTTGNTYPGELLQFTQVSRKKVTYWSLEEIGRRSGIGIRIYKDDRVPTKEDPSPDYDSNLYQPEIVPSDGSSSFQYLPYKNENFSTNVVPTIPGEGVLQSSFTRFGLSGVEPPNDRPNEEHPQDVIWIYDPVPNSDSLGSSGAATCGKYNYVQEGASWPSTRPGHIRMDCVGPDIAAGQCPNIDFREWEKYMGSTFDPNCAQEQLVYTRRQFVRSTQTCGVNFVNGQVVYQKYTWCKVLDRFWITAEEAGRDVNGQMMYYFYFIPRIFSVQATVTLPAGVLTRVISSRCPAIQSESLGGVIFVTMTSTEPLTNTVSVSLSTDCPKEKPQCCNAATLGSRNYDLQPNVGTTIRAGECQGHKLYMNIRTLDRPNQPCFSPPLDITSNANRSASSLPFIKPYVDSRIFESEMAQARALADTYIGVEEDNIRFQDAARDIPNEADYRQRIEDIIRNRTIEVNRIVLRNHTIDQATVDRIVKERTARIIHDLEITRNASRNQERIIHALETRNRLADGQIKDLQARADRVERDNERTQQAVRDLKNGVSSTPPTWMTVLVVIALIFALVALGLAIYVVIRMSGMNQGGGTVINLPAATVGAAQPLRPVAAASRRHRNHYYDKRDHHHHSHQSDGGRNSDDDDGEWPGMLGKSQTKSSRHSSFHRSRSQSPSFRDRRKYTQHSDATERV